MSRIFHDVKFYLHCRYFKSALFRHKKRDTVASRDLLKHARGPRFNAAPPPRLPFLFFLFTGADKRGQISRVLHPRN